MKTMTDRAWEFLIAESTADELVKKLGEMYEAIQYKRTIEEALHGNWMSKN